MKKLLRKYNRLQDRLKRSATSCIPVHFDQQLYDRAIRQLESSYLTKCATQFDSYFASDYYDRYIASKSQAVTPYAISHFDSVLYDQKLFDLMNGLNEQVNLALNDLQFNRFSGVPKWDAWRMLDELMHPLNWLEDQ